MPNTFSKVIALEIVIIYFLLIFNFFILKYNFRNVNNKNFSDPIKKKMMSLLKAISQTELEEIFLNIEKSGESGIEGILLKICFFKTNF